MFQGTERFEIRERLGEGGMGVVYRAYDRQLESEVALKTLRALDAAAIYRMKREFRSLADISHKNLVSLHELVSDKDAWFFTMELVYGVDFIRWVRPEASGLASAEESTLDDTVELAERRFEGEGLERTIARADPRRKPPDEARLRSALQQLALGISVLHEHGRFHRDIKPSNVMVTREGRVVLLDFGLVTMLAEESADPEMMTRHVVGTIGYMAPEQAAGMPATAAGDWYCVGVVLFEALTGLIPFSGKPRDVLAAKQKLDAPRPSDLMPGVAEDLDELCASLLSRDPQSRPSGKEILDRLGVEHAPAGISSVMGMRASGAGAVRTFRSRGGGSKSDAIILVGRERHMEALGRAFRATLQERAVVVLIRGGSGMGKSILVKRFIDDLLEREAPLVLSGRCYERESVPFKVFDNVVDALCRHLMRLGSKDCAALVPRDAVHLVRIFPVLWRIKAFREASPEGPAIVVPDAHEHRRRAFAALRELFERLCAKRKVIIHVDDMQWGDLDSALLLAALLAPPDPPALLFIGCHRSDDVDTSAPLRALIEAPRRAQADVREVSVDPLAPEEAASLVAQMAQGDLDPCDVSSIVEEAKGNPFVIDELVRHAKKTRREPSSPGRLSYESCIARRIDKLPTIARSLLEIVCVFSRPLLQAAALKATDGGGEAQPALVVLLSEHLIRTRVVGEEEALEPYHERIRGAVIALLGAEEIAQHHARLVRALEGQKEPDHEALVEHLIGSGDRSRAREHAAVAARQAERALAFDRAAAFHRLSIDLGVELRMAISCEEHERLATSLANAGRGRDSAQAFMAAAKAAVSADRALALRRAGAEQLLRSGHVDEGFEVISTVLADMGMALAATPRRALASLLVRRAQVRLRGRGFQARSESELPAQQIARIDVLWSVSMGLAMVDTARGSDFQARHLLLALKAGERYRLARALAMEACYSATGGGPAKERTTELVAEADRLARELDHPHALGLARYATGVAAFLCGRFSEAREATRDAEQIFRERCTAVAWELASARVFHLWSVGFLGDLQTLTRMIRQNLREAEERGDRYAAANYRTGLANLSWLIADDPDGARRQLQAVMDNWSQRGFHIQHYYDLIARAGIDLYTGAGRDAYRRVQQRWRDLSQSLLLMVQFVRTDALTIRARTALAAAKDRSPDRAELLERTTRDARRIIAEKMEWSSPIGYLLLAGAEQEHRRSDRALGLYQRALDGFLGAGMALYGAVAKRRLGELLGGDHGRGLLQESRMWMASQGIRDPDRLTAMLAP
jgi:hypothetical protein